MSSAITEFQPTQFSFTVRFVQGYRFLDRCGEAIVRLEDTLDKGWIPGEVVPTGGQLRNFALGMEARFNTESLTMTQTEFLSFEHFLDQSCKTYEILRSTFEIKHILSPVLRVIYQVGFPELDSAEKFVRDLQLGSPNTDLLGAVGGTEAAFTFTLCTHAKVEPQGSPVTRRRRIEVSVIRQERQPRFDERIMRRLALLPARYQGAMGSLRKLRRQHTTIAEIAAQFDMENTLESEFNSGTFNLADFLKDSRQWTEETGSFITSKYRPG